VVVIAVFGGFLLGNQQLSITVKSFPLPPDIDILDDQLSGDIGVNNENIETANPFEELVEEGDYEDPFADVNFNPFE